MSTKCKVKLNKLGEMINDILIKVSENKQITYSDIFKLKEKHNAICILFKGSSTKKQGGYFKYLAFIKNGNQKRKSVWH